MNRYYVVLIALLNFSAPLQCMLLSRNLGTAAALTRTASLKPISTECHDRVAAVAKTVDMKYRLKAYATLMAMSSSQDCYKLSPFDVMSEEEKNELGRAYLSGIVALMRCWGKDMPDKPYSFDNFFMQEIQRDNPSLFRLKSSVLITNPGDIGQWNIQLHCSVGDLCDDSVFPCDLKLIAMDSSSINRVEMFHETLCAVAKNIDDADPLIWLEKHSK